MHWKCWRQIDETMEENEELVCLETPQPMMVKFYYHVCVKIDQNNQKKKADIELECKASPHDQIMGLTEKMIDSDFDCIPTERHGW